MSWVPLIFCGPLLMAAALASLAALETAEPAVAHAPADPASGQLICRRVAMRPTKLILPAALAFAGCAMAAERAPVFRSDATATANTKAALARIKRLNPRLNAVIAVDPTALDQARS